MAENKAQLILDGDVSPLRQKLREAGRDLKKFGDDSKQSVDGLSSAVGGLSPKFAALGAVLSVGGLITFAKNAIDAADRINDLSQQIGISVPQLAGYKLAAESSGLTLDTFGNAVKRLSVYMVKHEKELAQAGITAKDVDGALAQLADRFTDMPDGAEKTAIAMALMGRTGADMIPLLNAGGEELRNMIARGRELYPVTKEMAAGADQFNDSLAELEVGTQGLTIALGNKLLPHLNRAIGLWRDNAKEIGNMKAALLGLGSLGVVGQTIAVLWANVVYVFRQVGKEIGGIAAQLAALLRGDFKGAGYIGDAMKRDAAVARKEIDDLEKRIMGLSKLPAPSKSSPDLANIQPRQPRPGDWTGVLGTGDKPAKPKKEFDLEGMRIEDAQRAERMADKELEAVRRAIEKELELRRKVAQQTLQIKLLQADALRSAEMARIDELAANSQYEVDLGQITQAQHLANLAVFNQQRLAAEQLYIDQKKELALQDPDQNPVELERIELEKQEIRQRYAQQGMDIQRQQSLESQTIWQELTDTISGLWDKGVQALMNGTLTWSNAMRAIGAEMTQWFVTNVVGKMVKEWLAGEAAKIAGKLGFVALEKALNATATATTIASKGTETTAVSSMNAVQAGTGAAASQASIPYIGPILALAAMATIFAAVSALGKKRSAAGGYDIPKGINPMTQLHEEEMVLPKKYANAIRNMTASGAGGEGEAGGATPMVVNISATDARGVRDLLLNNQQALVEALKSAQRNFER